jgi:hypothetical protein
LKLFQDEGIVSKFQGPFWRVILFRLEILMNHILIFCPDWLDADDECYESTVIHFFGNMQEFPKALCENS